MGCALLLGRCGPKVAVSRYSYEKQLLVQADSLFRAGNYEYAIRKYSRIRDEYAKSEAGAKAQYNLGYVNIYYDNPFADYAAALREFKRFQAHYPRDRRIESANNWIRILTVLQDFDSHYHGNTQRLKEVTRQQHSVFRNYETLQDAYLRCDKSSDSLRQVIKAYEIVIKRLENPNKIAP